MIVNKKKKKYKHEISTLKIEGEEVEMEVLVSLWWNFERVLLHYMKIAFEEGRSLRKWEGELVYPNSKEFIKDVQNVWDIDMHGNNF